MDHRGDESKHHNGDRRKKFSWQFTLGDLIQILIFCGLIISVYVDIRETQHDLATNLKYVSINLATLKTEVKGWEMSLKSDLNDKIQDNKSEIREIRKFVGKP